MPNEKNVDNLAPALFFGALFVLGLKLAEFTIRYFFADFASTNQILVTGMSTAVGALVASSIVTYFFPAFLWGKREKTASSFTSRLYDFQAVIGLLLIAGWLLYLFV